MVKPVQDGVCHNSACSVEAMPPALQMHEEIQGRIGQARPRLRIAYSGSGSTGSGRSAYYPSGKRAPD